MKTIDTLILSDGTIERYATQDLDTYPHVFELNHEELLDKYLDKYVAWFGERVGINTAIKTCMDYLKQFNNIL